MEQWQREGFESFRAWRLAKEKARRVAKKAAATTAAETASTAAAAAAAESAAVPVAASGADEPMAVDEVDEDVWPIYNNPVATVSSASFLENDHEHARGPPTQEPPPPLPAPPSEPTLVQGVQSKYVIPLEALAGFDAASNGLASSRARPRPPSSSAVKAMGGAPTGASWWVATAIAEAMELDEATLAVVNPSTQDDVLMASPVEQRTLLQPSNSELTPGGVNLRHRLEEVTPRGTHAASAEYKAAAATPEGEDAEARERRLATERQRLHRARESVKSSLKQQLEKERAALAAKAALAMKLARRSGEDPSWEANGSIQGGFRDGSRTPSGPRVANGAV